LFLNLKNDGKTPEKAYKISIFQVSMMAKSVEKSVKKWYNICIKYKGFIPMTEYEEVLKLRALVKQQQSQLEEQRAVLEAKERIIEKQNIQIENMIQALLHARKKIFGPSTEVTKGVDGQLSLFETAQELGQELANEQKKITIREYKRTPRQPGVRADMLAGLAQEVEEYIIPQTDTCSVCQSKLKVIGKRVIRTEVEFIPAKLIVKQIVQEVAKCTKCKTAS